MSFHASILTLYPEMFPGHLGHSLAGKALEQARWSYECQNIRDFALDKHKNVDDKPAGGGAGMVLKADVLARAIDHVSPLNDTIPRILLSPRGKPLTQKKVRLLSKQKGIMLICGHFAGVDQRVIESHHLEEISIGDYILSGGEPAALILLDSIIRLLPGVMGNSHSSKNESFENGLLEHPLYTKPNCFEGQEIPQILTSGHHKNIEKWRHQQSLKLTKERRPDLFIKKDD